MSAQIKWPEASRLHCKAQVSLFFILILELLQGSENTAQCYCLLALNGCFVKVAKMSLTFGLFVIY